MYGRRLHGTRSGARPGHDTATPAGTSPARRNGTAGAAGVVAPEAVSWGQGHPHRTPGGPHPRQARTGTSTPAGGGLRGTGNRAPTERRHRTSTPTRTDPRGAGNRAPRTPRTGTSTPGTGNPGARGTAHPRTTRAGTSAPTGGTHGRKRGRPAPGQSRPEGGPGGADRGPTGGEPVSHAWTTEPRRRRSAGPPPAHVQPHPHRSTHKYRTVSRKRGRCLPNP